MTARDPRGPVLGLIFLAVLVFFLPTWWMVAGVVAVEVVLWLALASLFSFYLQNLARFSLTYGSLGGIVITLMFFYLSALIFVFGAEINSARRRSEAARLRAEHARRQQAASG